MIKYDEYYIYNTLHFSLGSMLEFRYITDFVEPPKRKTRRKHGLIFDISKTRSGWTVEQSAGSLGRNDGDIFQPPGLWPSLIFKHWQYVTMLLYIVACWTDGWFFLRSTTNQCFLIILWLQCCFTPQDSVMLAEEVIFKPRLRAQHVLGRWHRVGTLQVHRRGQNREKNISNRMTRTKSFGTTRVWSNIFCLVSIALPRFTHMNFELEHWFVRLIYVKVFSQMELRACVPTRIFFAKLQRQSNISKIHQYFVLGKVGWVPATVTVNDVSYEKLWRKTSYLGELK